MTAFVVRVQQDLVYIASTKDDAIALAEAGGCTVISIREQRAVETVAESA